MKVYTFNQSNFSIKI